jgi:dCMP deaminase
LATRLTTSDLQFLRQCELAKDDSFDPRRKVGAVISDAEGRLVAKGANRPPQGIWLDRQSALSRIASDPDWKYFVLEHAERNAINAANNERHIVRGGTMYCSLFPCADCARAIVGAGIRRLVAPNFSGRAEDEKWRTHFKYAAEILQLGGVQLDLIPEYEKIAAAL